MQGWEGVKGRGGVAGEACFTVSRNTTEVESTGCDHHLSVMFNCVCPVKVPCIIFM